MNVFKTSISLLLFSITFLFFSSCSRHDEVTNDTISSNREDTSLLSSSRATNYTDEDYQKMMSTLRNDIDNILNDSKPQNLNLYDYKMKLINGELSLPQESNKKINDVSQDLLSYGRNLASVNNIGVNMNDDAEVLALGGLFSPGDNTEVTFPGDYSMQVTGNVLTWGEVAECVAVGIGANAIWALGVSGASSWTAAALASAFSAVAKRFLGPIGVAIAVVSFSVCLVQQAND